MHAKSDKQIEVECWVKGEKEFGRLMVDVLLIPRFRVAYHDARLHLLCVCVCLCGVCW